MQQKPDIVLPPISLTLASPSRHWSGSLRSMVSYPLQHSPLNLERRSFPESAFGFRHYGRPSYHFYI